MYQRILPFLDVLLISGFLIAGFFIGGIHLDNWYIISLFILSIFQIIQYKYFVYSFKKSVFIIITFFVIIFILLLSSSSLHRIIENFSMERLFRHIDIKVFFSILIICFIKIFSLKIGWRKQILKSIGFLNILWGLFMLYLSFGPLGSILNNQPSFFGGINGNIFFWLVFIFLGIIHTYYGIDDIKRSSSPLEKLSISGILINIILLIILLISLGFILAIMIGLHGTR